MTASKNELPPAYATLAAYAGDGISTSGASNRDRETGDARYAIAGLDQIDVMNIVEGLREYTKRLIDDITKAQHNALASKSFNEVSPLPEGQAVDKSVYKEREKPYLADEDLMFLGDMLRRVNKVIFDLTTSEEGRRFMR